MSEAQSPCIGVCRINMQFGLCEGCFRTRGEIAAWPHMDRGERRKIMRILPQRQAESAVFD